MKKWNLEAAKEWNRLLMTEELVANRRFPMAQFPVERLFVVPTA